MHEPVHLAYALDAYCGWCYGFAPKLHEFAEANAGRIRIRVLSGGLFTGQRSAPISAFPHIPNANARIAELTGVEFGQGYLDALDQGTIVMDSTDPATGLLALSRHARGRELEAAGAIQQAWYQDGKDLSDPQVYADIAQAMDLDAHAVASTYTDPTVRTEAESQFAEVRSLGVEGYPTLLLHTSDGLHKVGGPVSSAEALTQALNQHLSGLSGAGPYGPSSQMPATATPPSSGTR